MKEKAMRVYDKKRSGEDRRKEEREEMEESEDRRKEERRKKREEREEQILLKEEKTSNLDRILGGIFTVFVITVGALGFIRDLAGSIPATTVLLLLLMSSMRNIPIGFRGQFKFFGARINFFVKEGWRVAPWLLLFGVKKEDCRARTTPMDDEIVTTKDNVEFKVEKLKVVWKIVSMDLFQNLEPDDLHDLLDDVVDQNIRLRIRHDVGGWKAVLGMKFSVKKKKVIHSLHEWGIEVLEIIAPKVFPVEESFRKALELEAKEKLETTGQTVEAELHAKLIEFFSGKGRLRKGGPKGPSLPLELANEAALIHMEKADKKTLSSSTFGLDAATLKAVLEGLKEMKK